MSDEWNCTVGGADFARAVLAVERSAAKDDSRPVLAGIQLEIDGDALTLVAADGFRLSFARVACTLHGADAAIFTVRHDPLVAFARKIKKAPTVTISPTGGGMWCFCNEKTKDAAIIPAIEGDYPDWRTVAEANEGPAMAPIATYQARYLADAAATAPPGSLLTIQRDSAENHGPGVMAIRDGHETVATHIIMPMLTHTDQEQSS